MHLQPERTIVFGIRGMSSGGLDTVLGVRMLKQTHDLTDYEAIEQLAFNIQWHYALDIGC